MTSPRLALSKLPLRCDYEQLRLTTEVQKEPLQDLVTYPDDDVLVHLQPREFRTLDQPIRVRSQPGPLLPVFASAPGR